MNLIRIIAFTWLSAAWPGLLFSQAGGPPSPVVVAKVVKTTQSASKSFIGTLMPVRKSTIGSAIDGRVTEIFVDAGDPVSMLEGQVDVNGHPLGQPMVQLRTVALDIQIEAAKIELQNRQQLETELKQTLPTEIESAEASVKEIKARLKYSEDNYQRLLELEQSGGGIPRRELDEAFSTFSAQSQLEIAAQTLLNKLTTTRDTRLRQARLRVEAQEAELRRLQDQLDEFTIRAPFAGYVTAKTTELGQWVSRGDAVMEIVQLDPIELVINVPQAYISQLQEALEYQRANDKHLVAEITVDDVPGLFEGRVVQIVPQADLRSRSFPVRIRIKNPEAAIGHALKSGMLARASLFIGRNDEILLVKKDALVLGGPSISLYVIGEDPQTQSTVVRPVPVHVGASIDDWIQVSGSVAAGDLVVVEGNERLTPGQQVQIAKELPDTLSKDPQASGNHDPPTALGSDGGN